MGISWHSKSFFDIFNPMKRFNIPTPHRLYQSPCRATNAESLSFYLQRHPIERLDLFLHFWVMEITKEVLFLIANLLPLNSKVILQDFASSPWRGQVISPENPQDSSDHQGILTYLGRESQTKPLFAAPTGWGVDPKVWSISGKWAWVRSLLVGVCVS